MKKGFAFFLLILTGMELGVLFAAKKYILTETAKKALFEQAQQMIEAAEKDDDEAVVRFMYPKVVQKMGGTEKARKIVEAARLSLNKNGAKVISTTIDDIRGCEEVGDQIQCVINGTQVLHISDMKLVNQTEIITFSDDGGKNWTFLSGGQDPKALRTNLPELSPNLPLREKQ